MLLGLVVLFDEVDLDGTDQLGQLALVFTAHLRESNNSGGLLVDDRAQTSLVLDNAVWHAHLSAKRRKENNQLNGVDIVGNDDEGSLLSLDQGDDVVQTVFNIQSCRV